MRNSHVFCSPSEGALWNAGSLFSLSGTVKGAVEGRYPDIEAVCRAVGTMSVDGWDLSMSVGDRTMTQNALCVDSNFLSLIPLLMAAGDRKGALETVGSVIVSQSFANTYFPGGNTVGNGIGITAGGGKTTLTITGVFEDMERTVLPGCDMIYRRAYASEDRSLRLTSLFALLTIVLTVMAMVAMSTYYARQRAKSTAIRKIMGCPRLEIYTHTLASFLSASLIAAVIATPLIYTYTGRWLQTYSYRIDNHWWMYLLALLIVGVIAALSISYRAVQLMNTNPALALRKD